MEFVLPITALKSLLPILAIIAGIFVITTQNAIISIFNLIVLYILVAFYLIYIGVAYIGISYIIIYVGAIAILFLFIIMMIDIEVVEKRSNNYLPLLFFLLSGFLYSFKNILYHIGIIKMKSLSVKEENLLSNDTNNDLFSSFLNFELLKRSYKLGDRIENENDNLIGIFNKEEMDMFNMTNGISILNDDNYDENILPNISFSSTHSNFNSDSYVIPPITILSNISPVLNDKLIHEYKDELINNYLLIIPDWDTAATRITQVSAIGDVLYMVWHSYIYIISVILLVGMIGSIILTAEKYQETRIIKISDNLRSGIISIFDVLNLVWNFLHFRFDKYYRVITFSNLKALINIFLNFSVKQCNCFTLKIVSTQRFSIPLFINNTNIYNIGSEDIKGNLFYFIVTNLIIALLLLSLNAYFSLSVKYIDKGGGFECGFTSFFQTRERFNVLFYRVSLLFLVFDLEIVLIFPYPTIYHNTQNISKNNVLIFLYILIVGFIYELKEGALNIVKKAHSTEINVDI